MKRITRITAAALAVGLVATGTALALANGDSLISLSYLNSTYIPSVVAQGANSADQKLTQTYESAVQVLEKSGYTNSNGSYSETFQSRDFTRGDKINLSTGSGFLMLSGKAVLSHSGTVIDVTEGQAVASGSFLAVGHRYLVGEDTSAQVQIKTGLGQGGIQGNYTWTKSGENAAPFVDVSSDDWYSSAVDYAYFGGLFSGMGDNQFAPQSNMNRAMMMTVLYHLAGSPESERLAAKSTFTDVPSDQWFYTFVAWAADQGVSAGTGNGEFSPNQPVTREQVVVLLYNFASNYMHLTLDSRSDITSCGDYSQVASWAQDAMSWAASCGVVSSGNGVMLEPGRSATRAEVAAMLMSFSQRYLS